MSGASGRLPHAGVAASLALVRRVTAQAVSRRTPATLPEGPMMTTGPASPQAATVRSTELQPAVADPLAGGAHFLPG